MSNVNRGKDFEGQIREALESVNDTAVLRLYDPQGGYAGVCNICDFVAYHNPIVYFIECKSCHGNTLSIYSNNPKKKYGAITNDQWEGLLKMSKFDGVVAGYFIWFVDKDVTVYIPASIMASVRDAGSKSIKSNDLPEKHYIIPSKKRRVLFDYDLQEFIENGGNMHG